MSQWFKKHRCSGIAKLRLFCFPYAGGNATIFGGWAEHLPSGVDLFAIQSPGRGRRFTETPISCLRTKVKELYSEIVPFLDVPSIFVGHSNGALVAFELARELQKNKVGNLNHLILSAKRAPHLPPIKPNLHNLPQEQFIKELKNYDFTPDEVLENEELMELFTPMLRADFSLSETYDFEEDMKLKTPTTLFWGNRDNDIPKDDMLAWQKCIDNPVNFTEFDGGHFFIDSSKDSFLTELNKILNNLNPG